MIYARHGGHQGWLPLTRRATKQRILVESSKYVVDTSKHVVDTSKYVVDKEESLQFQDVLSTFLERERERLQSRVRGFLHQMKSVKKFPQTFSNTNIHLKMHDHVRYKSSRIYSSLLMTRTTKKIESIETRYSRHKGKKRKRRF